MNKYLITYHNARLPMDPEVLEQAKTAFGKWLQESGQSVVDPGAPSMCVGQVATQTPSPEVELGGYSIIQAESDEDASRVLQSHPFIARGGTLQVNKIISV